MYSLKKLYFFIAVLLLLTSTLTYGYEWFTQTYFGVSTCTETSTNYILLEQMNKCFQTSKHESTRSSCAMSTDGTDTVIKNVITYTSGDCTGSLATNTTTRIGTSCLGGIKFGCAVSEEDSSVLEAMPGIGTWQKDADGGLGDSCSYVCGPQFVEALPTTCMNNGLVSWEYSCSGNNLNYDYYLSTDCTASTKLTDDSAIYPTDTCFDFEEQRGYAACTIAALPGTAFLDFSASSPQGDVQSDETSAGVTAAIVLILLFAVIGIGVFTFWFLSRYDMRHRLNKSQNNSSNSADVRGPKDVELDDFNSKGAAGSGAGDMDNRDPSVSDFHDDGHYKQPSTLKAVLTCACCYDDYN